MPRHTRNSDEYLGYGTPSQVSAIGLKSFIDLNKFPDTIITPIVNSNPIKTKSVSVFGNYACLSLAQGNGGFALFDISSIKSPKVLGKGSSTWSVNKTIFLSENRLLVLVDTNTACIESWDISNKLSPVRNQVVTVVGSNKFCDMQVKDNLCFVSDTSTGIHIFDITNPTSIVKIAGIPSSGSGNLRIRGNNLWFTEKVAKTLVKYDITNPLSPSLLSTLSITDSVSPLGFDMSSDENFAIIYNDNSSSFYYFKNSGSGLIQTLSMSVSLGTLDAQGSSACIIDSDRNLFYMISYLGIYIYQLSDCQFLFNFFPTTNDVRGNTSGVLSFRGNRLILGARTADKLVIIKDPYLYI